MSQSVVHVPGLPDDVEVRRSTRRRRSVTAYREGGRTIVVVPARMARADIAEYVVELVGRLDAREKRSRRTDSQLHARALELSHRYLDDRAVPRTVRWVSNQKRRWGSCTPVDAAIRLSDRLQPMPEHVVDYVLLHELVHLLVPGHGPDFEAWMQRYPRLLEARAFLAGVDHALGHGLEPEPDDPDAETDDAGEPAAAPPAIDLTEPPAAAPAPAAPVPAAAAPRRRTPDGDTLF
ncbi:MAG: YgjP-like metallopeptidase domain-containing protein [Candidatus Nanopelagicales bacterium]